MSYQDSVFTAAGCADRCMQVTVVDSGVTALVLNHHHGFIGFVGGCDFKVLQRHVVGLIERHHTIVLLMLVSAIAGSGVVVVIDFHVALAALTLDGEGVYSTHTHNIRYAYFLIIFTGLDLQRYGAFHAKSCDGIDGTLDGGVVAACANNLSAAHAACHCDGGGDRFGHGDGFAVHGDSVERSRGGLTFRSRGLHIVGEPEVVGAAVGDAV